VGSELVLRSVLGAAPRYLFLGWPGRDRGADILYRQQGSKPTGDDIEVSVAPVSHWCAHQLTLATALRTVQYSAVRPIQHIALTDGYCSS